MKERRAGASLKENREERRKFILGRGPTRCLVELAAMDNETS